MVLVPYQSGWARNFEAARAAIEKACGDLLVAVEHIGSTAVPGLPAKPIIDIMPGVRSLTDADVCVPLLEQAGYVARGEHGIPGRRYFTLEDARTGRRLQHVHMFVAGDTEWIAHLAFRDYLRIHADWRDRYRDLKFSLAAAHPDDSAAYAEAKTGLVRDVVARARADGLPLAGD